ncbi:MAG TPA: RNA methyltransferase [Candidatus Acidoferrales bacterium]|nr:RNA methyltransferase [Candidatus Acidoferrales bacterium]
MVIRIILVEPEKAGNIGAVARAMKNFDLSSLWIVNPKEPLSMEARAFAMHGYDVLAKAKIVRTLPTALRGLDLIVSTSAVAASSRSNLVRVPMTPNQLAAKIHASKGSVGIVFGRESSGLSNREVEKCDFLVTIPASRTYNVLNLASAATIIFYELFRKHTTHTGPKLASKVVKVRLQTQFDQLVKRSGVQEHKRKLAERSFRNVVSRSFISQREASLLLGTLRRATGKLA